MAYRFPAGQLTAPAPQPPADDAPDDAAPAPTPDTVLSSPVILTAAPPPAPQTVVVTPKLEAAARTASAVVYALAGASGLVRGATVGALAGLGMGGLVYVVRGYFGGRGKKGDKKSRKS
jgi:hypothetical protein